MPFDTYNFQSWVGWDIVPRNFGLVMSYHLSLDLMAQYLEAMVHFVLSYKISWQNTASLKIFFV